MRVYVGLYRGHILVARVTLPSYLKEQEVRQLSSGVGDAGGGGRGRSTRGAGRSGASWFEIA